MSRLTLEDSIITAVIKMSDGNPGAALALAELIDRADFIDPDAMLGGMGKVMMLDTCEIYGSDVYVLWNDKCDCDTRKMIMLMRATQLGIFPQTKLNEMAADQRREVNLTAEEFDELDKQVCEQLPNFKKAA